MPVSARLLLSYRGADVDGQEDLRQRLLMDLAEPQFEELEDALIVLLHSQEENQASIVEAAISELLLFTSFDVDLLLSKLVAVTELVGYSLLRGGGGLTKKELYRQLPANPNFGLTGLAWIADDEIVRQFADWRRAPPSWADQLYTPAHTYCYEAGWELTSDDQKRELFSRNCFGLFRKNTSSPPSPIEGPDKCKLCGRTLFLLGLDAGLFSSFESEALHEFDVKIPFCDLCTWHRVMRLDNFVTQIEPPAVSFSDEEIPDWFADADNNGTLFGTDIEKIRRDPFFAAQALSLPTYSQFGGSPTWLQDAEYPRCSTCQRTMNFIVQIDSDEFEDLYPGTFYFFKCTFCLDRLAVTKQCT